MVRCITMTALLSTVRQPLDDGAIQEHYQLVAPLMERLFGHIAIVWTAFPQGTEHPPQWHGRCFGHYSKLSAEHLLHLVSAAGAREFFSWSPLPDDQLHARFARILLERPGLAQEPLKEGAIAMRSVLAEEGREAILVCDGIGNLALWVPLQDAPEYPRVMAWAHAIAQHAAELHPDLLSTKLNTHKDGCVHVHVSTNAVGRCSALPYTLRVRNGCVAAPLRWPELGNVDLDAGISVEALPARLRDEGEIFGDELATIRALRLPLEDAVVVRRAFRLRADGAAQGDTRLPKSTEPRRGSIHHHDARGHDAAALRMPQTGEQSRGWVIRAAIAVLSDGVPRDPDQLHAAAIKAKLFPHKCSAHVIDNELKRYIERMVSNGRKPAIVEGLHRMYRINEPPDGWPGLPPAAGPAPSAQTLALIARLGMESHSTVPEKFETAVCDAFDALGFLATHVGG